MEAPRRLIFLDTETTGMSSVQDRIVEIGAVEVEGVVETGRVYHRYVNPMRPVDPEAVEVHGLTDEFLSDKPIFAEIAEEFCDFVRGAVLVAHNAAFDLGFLEAELRRCGLVPTWSETIDTLKTARLKFPGSPASLDALCNRFGVDTSSRVKHGALTDVYLLIDVYIHLAELNVLRLKVDDASSDADSPADSPLLPEWARQDWFPLRAAREPTSAEAEAHAEFLGKIKGPRW